MNGTDETVRNGQVLQTESLKIVLNGGSEAMESATIPFQWFFSDTVIEEQPTHLLIIDQNKSESTGRHTDRLGERGVSLISRGADFMQFSSPGRHRIAFIACKFPGDKRERAVLEAGLFRMGPYGGYDCCIQWLDVETLCGGRANYLESLGAVAATIVEIEVPKEFFAEKPKSVVGQRLWNWVNLWHSRPPRDECDFRKRIPVAFTLQPPAVAVGKLLQFGLYAPFASLYLLLARFIALFIGYRPAPMLTGLDKLWKWRWNDPRNLGWEILRWGKGSYGIWEAGWQTEPAQKTRYMWVTGGEVFIAALGLLSLTCSSLLFWLLVQKLLLAPFGQLGTLLFNALLVGALGILFPYIAADSCLERHKEKEWYRRLCSRFSLWREKIGSLRKKREEKKTAVEQVAVETRARDEREQKEKKEYLLYFEWLKGELHISKAPPRVEVKALPPAFRGRRVQRFRVAYWDMKSRMCRPYSK